MSWSYFVTTILGEDQLGPVPNDEFVELVMNKVIKPTSKIHHPSFTRDRWVEAKEVKPFLELRQQLANRQAAEKRKPEQVKPTSVESQRNAEPSDEELSQSPSRKIELEEPGRSVAVFEPRRYPGISAVIVIFYVVAVLLALSALLMVGSVVTEGLSGGREVAQGTLAAMVLVLPMASMLLFGAVVNFALAQVLRLLVHVQENTQRAAFNSENSK